MDIAILICIVRGLNKPPKRRVVASILSDKGCNITCLQETKLAVITKQIVVEILGPKFGDNFIYKAADGTRGGILIAGSSDHAAAAPTIVAGYVPAPAASFA